MATLPTQRQLWDPSWQAHPPAFGHSFSGEAGQDRVPAGRLGPSRAVTHSPAADHRNAPSCSERQAFGFGSILQQRAPRAHRASHGRALLFTGFKFPCSFRGSSVSHWSPKSMGVIFFVGNADTVGPGSCRAWHGSDNPAAALPTAKERNGFPIPLGTSSLRSSQPQAQCSEKPLPAVPVLDKKPREETWGGQTIRRRVLKDVRRN